ncbi:unnamed protein product [Lactuca virosa]|uniref:Uncharacterized protein n=1 Tax=Lactuca virosa TaxID=75947 RepID=A0AAU9M7K4_9ASTR|nr:unnamed protein product [Lactuca virosa]
MDSDRKRVSTSSSKNGVVMGSVWDSRMKGSFKVFNGDDKNQEIEKPTEKNNPTETTGEIVKMEKARSENKKVFGELSVSVDGIGIKKSPVQMKKGRQEWIGDGRRVTVVVAAAPAASSLFYPNKGPIYSQWQQNGGGRAFNSDDGNGVSRRWKEGDGGGSGGSGCLVSLLSGSTRWFSVVTTTATPPLGVVVFLGSKEKGKDSRKT